MDRSLATVVRVVEGRTTLTTALTWTPALTISHQHAPSLRVVAGAGAQGRRCKLVKPTKTAAEPARTTVSKERSGEKRVLIRSSLFFASMLIIHIII